MSNHDPSQSDPPFGSPAEYPEIRLLEPLWEVLARSENPGEHWLWCIFCEHFFQAKHLRIDFQGNREGCAFCNCAGFHCAIFPWDAFKEDDDPAWPRSVAELSHGLKLPSGA